MAEAIKSWLTSRLGIIIDLSPHVIGPYCQDGTLIAKILHSYDVINDSQLDTLPPTSDPALARVNLKHLRVWLKFIGVTCDDKMIRDISHCKGTAALQLIYKVYLCLEDKDRLHFITLEKEREKYIPNSEKFDVKVVNEDDFPLQQLPKHPFYTLAEKYADNIEWYKKKFQRVSENFRQERDNFRKSQHIRKNLQESLQQNVPKTTDLPEKTLNVPKSSMFGDKRPSSSRRSSNVPKITGAVHKNIKVNKTNASTVETKLDKSAKNPKSKEAFSAPQLKIPAQPSSVPKKLEEPSKDEEIAKEFINILKQKKLNDIEQHKFKEHMQKMLLKQVWDKVDSSNQLEVDRLIAIKVLRQSEYEKQMVTKLLQIHNERSRLASNRKIVDDLMQKAREDHARLIQQSQMEMKMWEDEEIYDEGRRFAEFLRRREQKRIDDITEMVKKIVNDMIDITVESSEIARTNDGSVPKHLWEEWKTLFACDMPIFTFQEDSEDIFSGENGDPKEVETIKEEANKEFVLAEAEFENYHQFKATWAEFLPEIDEETREYLDLGMIVLGYIVHRLINLATELQTQPFIKPRLPDMKIRAVVLGIDDESSRNQFEGYLRHKKIKVVKPEDTINFCLSQYKEELKDYKYVDLENINVDAKTIVNSGDKDGVPEKNQHEDDKDPKDNSAIDETKAKNEDNPLNSKDTIDEETQTSKRIPFDDMDPVLTDAAFIGKLIHETFTVGQPISEQLMAKTIFEYLMNLDEVEGWVLINYPNTDPQMVWLECCLSGRQPPEHILKGLKTFDPYNVYKGNIFPMINFVTGETMKEDESGEIRKSSLVPNPLHTEEDLVSYLTAFIRILPQPEGIVSKPEDIFEILPEDVTNMDKFYVDQGLASVVYYTVCDASTMKRAARLVIGETSVPRKSSVELFGPDSKTLDDNGDTKSVSKQGSNSVSQVEAKSMKANDPKPGEPEWPWVNLPLPKESLIALKTLWSNLETVYIDSLKNTLIEKRSNMVAVLPYKKFVVQKIMRILSRPENKQKQELVDNFYSAFNGVPDVARVDNDIKAELNSKVGEFQTKLWDICDAKRREAEAEERKIILDHWPANQIICLVNIYLNIIQLEMDRFVDTMKFIQSYYLTMLQRSVHGVVLQKVLLHKLILDSTRQEMPEEELGGDRSGKRSSSTLGKQKDGNNNNPEAHRSSKSLEKYKNSISSITQNDLKSKIDEILLQLLSDKISNDNSLDLVSSTLYKIIDTNVEYIKSIIKKVSTSVSDVMKREERVSRSQYDRNEKRLSSKRASTMSHENQEAIESMLKKFENLFVEWKYALMYEVNKIKLRIAVLESSAKSDINYLLETMRKIFAFAKTIIEETYLADMENVDNIIKIFMAAIENGRSVRQKIILDGDTLLVRQDSLLYPSKESLDSILEFIGGNFGDFMFDINQLRNFKDTFKRSAPSGYIARRSFIFILQDLVTREDKDGVNNFLPLAWCKLENEDIERLVEAFFGQEEYIDWREFLICLMNIPMPDQDQLLDAQDRYRLKDPDRINVVLKHDFMSTRIWIDEFMPDSTASSFYVNINEVDGKESIGEKNVGVNEDKDDENEEISCDVDVIKSTSDSSSEDEVGSEYKGLRQLRKEDEEEGEADDDEVKNREEEIEDEEKKRMKINAIKQLFSEMYLANYCTVMYLYLLLAFCKDDKPSIGLGKAISLALGQKICLDFDEGEKYVNTLLSEKKKNDEKVEKMRRELLQYCEEILETSIDNVMEICEVSLVEIQESSVSRKDIVNKNKTQNPVEKRDGLDETKANPSNEQGLRNESELIKVDDGAGSINANDETLKDSKTNASISHEKKEGSEKIKNKKEVTYWIPTKTFESVVLSQIPFDPELYNKFHETTRLSEFFHSIYQEIQCNELEKSLDLVLAHRIIYHERVLDILMLTRRFTNKNAAVIIAKILQDREKIKSKEK